MRTSIQVIAVLVLICLILLTINCGGGFGGDSGGAKDIVPGIFGPSQPKDETCAILALCSSAISVA